MDDRRARGVLVASLVAAALVGPVHVQLWPALTGGDASADHVILFRTRLPRVLLASVVGGSLGAAGAALQGLLGNPLACPHVLGISGGAAVAGVVALVVGADPVSPLVPLAAFGGALGSIAIVSAAARAGGRTRRTRPPRRRRLQRARRRGAHAGERARQLHRRRRACSSGSWARSRRRATG
jgi:iron complex transport system permease protein